MTHERLCTHKLGPFSLLTNHTHTHTHTHTQKLRITAHKSHTHTHTHTHTEKLRITAHKSHTHTEAADYCSQVTHTHTHTQKLRITTLNFPPRLPCRLVEGPHPGVNGTEPACLCRDWNQSKASWKQLLREDFQICMEGRLSWDWQKLSPFLTIEKVSDALWKMRQLGECPLGDWQWMLEHSCQGLAWMSALGGESWGGVGEATS